MTRLYVPPPSQPLGWQRHRVVRAQVNELKHALVAVLGHLLQEGCSVLLQHVLVCWNMYCAGAQAALSRGLVVRNSNGAVVRYGHGAARLMTMAVHHKP